MSVKSTVIGGIVIFFLGATAGVAVLGDEPAPAPEVRTEVVVKERVKEVEVEVYGGMTPECTKVVEQFATITDTDKAIEDATSDMLDQYGEMKKAAVSGDIGLYSGAQELANTAFNNLTTETGGRLAEVNNLNTLIESCTYSTR